MISRVLTAALSGIDAVPVSVEVDLSSGIPGLTIGGLPDATVNESKERIRSAIKNSGFDFPLRKLVVNMAPASLKKEGSGFDLPLAVGILLAAGTLTPTEFLDKTLFVGELSLEGAVRRVHGILSIAMAAKKEGYTRLVVPEENFIEASLVEGLEVYALSHLNQIPVFLFNPSEFLRPWKREALLEELQTTRLPGFVDFSHIKGQEQAKRALEIAAAGGHNILLAGPPGSGKSLMAKAFAGILPPLTFEEVQDVSRVYSVAGLLNQKQALVKARPFRTPHHSTSSAALIGGGTSTLKVGEMSLAHRGVLFLDEFPEFRRDVLEALRQPLEDGEITVRRAAYHAVMPAKFILVAAMNPCPCGYHGDTSRHCTCSEGQIARYAAKMSGPLLDRIDMHLEVPRLSTEELLNTNGIHGDTTDVIRERVTRARQHQTERFAGSGIYTNSEMTPAMLREYCILDEAAKAVMQSAIARMQLSARAFDRILRLSRTLADLGDSDHVEAVHLAEALRFRGLERLYQPGLTV